MATILSNATAQPSPLAHAPIPHWTTYLDLFMKALLPLAVLAATLIFNDADKAKERLRSNRSDCVGHQFELAKLPKEADAAEFNNLWSIISEECKAADKTPFRATLRQVASTTANVGIFAQASRDLGRALPTPMPVTNAAAAPAPVIDRGPAAALAPAATLRPRVYIQIQRDDQRPAAEALRQLLSTSQLGGRMILVPGVELPTNARARVAQTELRCAGEDCRPATELAAYIAARIGRTSIPVRDISVLYRGSAPRPGHYELWIGPEQLTVTAVDPNGG